MAKITIPLTEERQKKSYMVTQEALDTLEQFRLYYTEKTSRKVTEDAIVDTQIKNLRKDGEFKKWLTKDKQKKGRKAKAT